jgi:hypothetical protein
MFFRYVGSRTPIYPRATFRKTDPFVSIGVGTTKSSAFNSELSVTCSLALPRLLLSQITWLLSFIFPDKGERGFKPEENCSPEMFRSKVGQRLDGGDHEECRRLDCGIRKMERTSSCETSQLPDATPQKTVSFGAKLLGFGCCTLQHLVAMASHLQSSPIALCTVMCGTLICLLVGLTQMRGLRTKGARTSPCFQLLVVSHGACLYRCSQSDRTFYITSKSTFL